MNELIWDLSGINPVENTDVAVDVDVDVDVDNAISNPFNIVVKGENVRHIDSSRAWRNSDFPELIEASDDMDKDRRDFLVEPRNIQIDSDGTWNLGGSNEFKPTMSALRDFCHRTGSAINADNKAFPAWYLGAMLDEYPSAASALINKHMRDYGKSMVFRTYKDNIIAILSENFVAIDNSHILKIAEKQSRRTGSDETLRIVRPVLTPERAHLRIEVGSVYPQGDIGPHTLGVMLTNSQIGNGSVSVYPYIQRTSCENSTIRKTEDAGRVNHVGSSGKRSQKIKMENVARLMVATFRHGTPKLMKAMIQSDYIPLPNLTDIIDGMCEENGWGQAIRGEIFTGTEADGSAYKRSNLVYGLTHAAHSTPGISADRSMEIELCAGDVLYASSMELKHFALVGRGINN